MIYPKSKVTVSALTVAVIALRHAFNSAATILKAMHEAEYRMDPRK